MKRALAGFLAAACAGSPKPAGLPLPDWRGPAVQHRHLGDGGLEVELTAPTGGHGLDLATVVAANGRADVHLLHRGPRGDFNTQVITPLRVTVPAERLGDARAVVVWITPPDGAAEQLALATARP